MLIFILINVLIIIALLIYAVHLYRDELAFLERLIAEINYLTQSGPTAWQQAEEPSPSRPLT